MIQLQRKEPKKPIKQDIEEIVQQHGSEIQMLQDAVDSMILDRLNLTEEGGL